MQDFVASRWAHRSLALESTAGTFPADLFPEVRSSQSSAPALFTSPHSPSYPNDLIWSELHFPPRDTIANPLMKEKLMSYLGSITKWPD